MDAQAFAVAGADEAGHAVAADVGASVTEAGDGPRDEGGQAAGADGDGDGPEVVVDLTDHHDAQAEQRDADADGEDREQAHGGVERRLADAERGPAAAHGADRRRDGREEVGVLRDGAVAVVFEIAEVRLAGLILPGRRRGRRERRGRRRGRSGGDGDRTRHSCGAESSSRGMFRVRPQAGHCPSCPANSSRIWSLHRRDIARRWPRLAPAETRRVPKEGRVGRTRRRPP